MTHYDIDRKARLTTNHGNMLGGLTPCTFIATGKVYPSDALMDSGYPLPLPKSDYAASTMRLERI